MIPAVHPVRARPLLGTPDPTAEDDLELLHADGAARGAETFEEVA